MQPISSTLATDTSKCEIRWLSISLRTLHCVELVLWFLLFLILVFQFYPGVCFIFDADACVYLVLSIPSVIAFCAVLVPVVGAGS